VDRRGWKIPPELMESRAEGEAEKSGVILEGKGGISRLCCDYLSDVLLAC
jgi:hypothetical protein